MSRHPKEQMERYGNDEAWNQLLQWHASGRLPHAILITGPQGIGKATLAHAFARHILAEGRRLNADDPLVRRMITGSHSDFLLVEPAFDEKKQEYRSEIVVEESRRISEFLALTPGEGQWRVVIIDSADDMNRNAANSVLKIIEEPPAHALILLISHNPGKLLPTIRSRCRTLKLELPDRDSFNRILRFAEPEIEPGLLAQLRILSGGSPGVALELLRHEGVERYEELVSLTAAIDPQKLQRLAETVGGRDQDAAWRMTVLLIRTLLTRLVRFSAQSLKDEELVEGEHEALSRLLTAHNLRYWLDLWEQSGQLLEDTDRLSLDKKQALLVTMHAFEGQQLRTG